METKNFLPETTYLSDYEAPSFLIDKTELRIEILEDSVQVLAILAIRHNPNSQCLKKSLQLAGQELTLQSISINGDFLTSEHYSLTENDITIYSVPDHFVLTTEVLIFPKNNTSLEGLFKSRTMYCTQCEAEGFRRITYYLDRPDVMSEFTTTIIGDRLVCPVLLSNGNLVDAGDMPPIINSAGVDLNKGRHWATWHDPFPKPSYLFAIVAGDLSMVTDSFTTCSGKHVDIRLYVEPKDIGKCSHAIQSLKNAMSWDERVFGREYDLDLYMIVAVDDFNMGAMENKGLNIFNTSCVLAHSETTTDDAFKRVEAVVAHEYFHNWSGNRVTCRDWFQLSLKEGFTVFRDAEFSAYMGSPSVKRVEDINFLRTVQFSEDSGPTAHPVQPLSYIEISNFYTVTIYEKGAEIVRMICTLLGPELFRRGSDLYFSKYDGQAVTIDDFVSVMAEVSGRDFGQFMTWYRKSGTPKLTVNSEYDLKTQQYKLSFKQSCQAAKNSIFESNVKDTYHIPVRVGLVGSQGALPLSSNADTSVLLEITEEEQTFFFDNISEYPVPSLLQDFSAPVKLEYPYSLDDLAALMSRDEDGFNRWNASQQLAINLMKPMLCQYRVENKLTLNPRLSKAFSSVIEEPGNDLAMKALVLTLPSELIMAELSEEIDVEAIHAVRNFILNELGEGLADQWRDLYVGNLSSSEYVYNADEAARRSLKNLALRYLSNGKTEDSLQLLQSQIYSADNMTDRLSSLATLINDSRSDAIGLAKESLHQFYEEWKHEPLVLNQWFQLQGSCSLPGGLKRVEALMSHSAFDFKNPNKVRSLIGVFCSNNPINFHCEGGAGYHFLADQVLALDKINPQISARILTPLTRWRSFPQARGELMRAQLDRIISTKKLSRDTYEIVSKSL
jgi:aminopeptidase N